MLDRVAPPARTAPVTTLKSMGISTEGLASQDSFDVWRDRYIGLNEVVVEPHRRHGFAASARDWPLGDLLVSQASAPARTLVRTARNCAADGIDHVVVRATRAGPLHCRVGDEAITVEPGRLFLGTFAQPSSIEYPDGPWVAAIVPRRLLAEWDIEAPKTGQPLLRGASADLLADFLLSFANRLDGATADEVPLLTEIFRSMMATCLRGDAAPRAAVTEEQAARQRAAIDRLIRREIASARLDADRLVALSGLSRATLYRLYEANGGVAARIRQMRLDRVHAALADPSQRDRPINEVAEAWGFHCTASFNRAFRKAFGTTPGAVRARGGTAPRRTDSDFVDWLQRV